MNGKPKDIDEYTQEIIDYIKSLSQEDRLLFACNSVFQTVLWAGSNHIEMLGILDCARCDIVKYVVNPSNDEQDGDEWKKLIDNN